MKALLEKIKTLDKKILIGGSIGIAAVIIAIVVILVVCLGGKSNEDDTVKENDTETLNVDKDVDDEDSDSADEDKTEAAFTVKVVDADGNAVAGVVVQVCKDSCVPATTDETGVATFDIEITEGYKLSILTLPEGYEYTGETEIALEAGITEYELKIQKTAENTENSTSSNGDSAGSTATQLDTTTKDDGTEILGAGSKDQPYLEIPDNDTRSVVTVSIPAGKTVYYGIQRAQGKIMTINDASAYVIDSNGTRHNASGGKVSFEVNESKAIASDFIYFQIGNSGSTAKKFTIKFSDPVGSRMNPVVINSLSEIAEGCKLSIAKNEEAGYYYSYKAEKSGTIKFYISSYTSSETKGYAAISVTKVINEIPILTNTDEDGIDDGNGGVYITVEVQKGDVLEINIASLCDTGRNKLPAADIVWNAVYQ